MKSGRLRALAVTTPKRVAAALDVRVVMESGVPAYEVSNWHGLVGPNGLQKEIVDRLNRLVNEALHSAEVARGVGGNGGGVTGFGGEPRGRPDVANRR